VVAFSSTTLTTALTTATTTGTTLYFRLFRIQIKKEKGNLYSVPLMKLPGKTM